jgi:hypothetical protein
MNLSQVLQQQWAANATLEALLPASKLQTGIFFATDPTKPYATLTRPEGVVATRTNGDIRFDTLTVRFAVYHGAASYDEGVIIAQAVDDAFDKLGFDLGDGDRVIQMMIDGPPGELQDQETGNWTWVIDFTCMIEMASG